MRRSNVTYAVFSITSTNPLREMIMKREIGNTEHGRAWCMKALHPAEPVTDCHGIPDLSAAATVLVEYTSRYVLSDKCSSTNVWGVDVSLVPHPLAFLGCTFHNQDETVHKTWTGYNTQLGQWGDTVQTKLNTWLGLAQRWRLAYSSATMELDAPALVNGGNVIAAQYPVRHSPTTCHPTPYYLDTVDGKAMHYVPPAVSPNRPAMGVPCFGYQSGDEPDYATLVNLPTSYQGLAKDGVYIPLKLSRAGQAKWYGEHSQRWWTGLGYPANAITGSSQIDTISYGALGANEIWNWPFANSLEPASVSYFRPMNWVTATNVAIGGPSLGDRLIVPCNEIWGHACFKNISVNANIIVTVRMGFEIQVQPGTTLSTMITPCPCYDPLAIAAYHEISRQMADAYPASYNDLNKLLKTIIAGAQGALPILAGIFPQLAPVASIGGLALSGASALRERIFRKQERREEEKAMIAGMSKLRSRPKKPVEARPPGIRVAKALRSAAVSFKKKR